MNRRDALTGSLGWVLLPAGARSPGAPDPHLAAVQGAWRGKLTYRDYARPDRLVTLPTRLFVALTAPGELALHYVFDDGPGKTVYAYERMAFDFENHTLAWTSGHPAAKTTQHRITSSSQAQDGGHTLAFERAGDGAALHRYALSLHPRALSLGKEEGTAAAGFQFRNRYEFTRGEG